MKPFTYERVTDPRAAGAAVSRAGAKFISGGTNLLDLMKLEIEQPTVKGLGELGICGAGAAVGNAVFNATAVRVRDFPITLDKVLPALPHQV